MRDKNEIEFISMPKGAVQLAEMINVAIDKYWAREMPEIELKEWLWKWAGTGKLLKAEDYNITIKRRCGKRRLEVMDLLLQGYQRRL